MTVDVHARGPTDDLDEPTRRTLLDRGKTSLADLVDEVRPLQDRVREDGDDALRALGKRFDGAAPDPLVHGPEELEAARDRVDDDLEAVLERARDRIEAFHEAQVPEDQEVVPEPGALAGRRVLPLERAGCYVPGGTAAYPSSALMTVAPARVADVGSVTVATPPGPDGTPPDLTLAAAAVAGADEVVAAGGAHAVFALAQGTASVDPVDKVVGPGNAYVAAAKLLVAGRVATDAPAGPSEILVLADGTADPDLVAWDLAAQAEHDPMAAAVLVATDPDLIEAVDDALAGILDETPRADVVEEALAARGGLLEAPDLRAAADFADAYAPEHLALHVDEPRRLLEETSTYGSAFLGERAPVALGDYGAGPNHVLPTGGRARGSAGLAATDFLRQPTHLEVPGDALETLAGDAAALAEAEGLHAHAESARRRLTSPEEDDEA